MKNEKGLIHLVQSHIMTQFPSGVYLLGNHHPSAVNIIRKSQNALTSKELFVQNFL